ncbi:hypothetical protein N7470_000950 [Penicillium chermesinum]|nr:hypothetical protein N7470_000950 [Penicillium chermesinum]
MQSPSPQLLRALRTSLSTPLCLSSPRMSSICSPTSTTRFTSLPPRRLNSSAIRPARIVPRSHSHKPASHDRGPDGVKIQNGDGLLLVGGEAFRWRPWKTTESAEQGLAQARAGMINAKGQFEVDEEVWGLLSVVWPRPDILILGLGATMHPLSPETKRHINSLGIRVEIQDTRNAAAQFNLLATERGVNEVAAAMIPIGWQGRS